MPTPIHPVRSHSLAVVIGALSAFLVTPRGPNVLPAPQVLPDESGFVCRPFGEQFADGGFAELCRQELADPAQATTPPEPPALTYYETRADGLWRCRDTGDLKPVCTLVKPAAPAPAKKGTTR